MNRAYSVIDFRSVDDEKRIIEGIASTPEVDSYRSVLEPMGAQFKLPMPLLLQHNPKQPIGHVIDVKPTKDGIRIRAKMERSPKPGVLEYLEDAWYQIKLNLVRGLSVGFESIEETFDKTFGGIRYLEWNWLELSAVTIAANTEASVTSVRSADESVLAASGIKERSSVVRLNLPASGPTQGKKMKNISEHIAALKSKRAANDEKLDGILTATAEKSETRSVEQKEEFETLTRENEALDSDIKDFEAREKSMLARATVIDTPAGHNSDPQKHGENQRKGSSVIEVRSAAPKGIGVARMAISMIRANNNPMVAADLAKKYWPGMPEVELALRAVIEAGDTTTSGWASQLVPAAQQMQNEFLEVLRPATIIGRIPGLRRVPFNISVPIETASGTAQWVGEGAAKPVTKLTLSSATLRWAKAAAIVAITKELARFSQPDAELVVRNSMVKTLTRFFDVHFVSALAEVTNVAPAGILNGITATFGTGTTAAAFRTDMATLLGKLDTNNVPFDNVVLLMSSGQALRLGLMVTDLGVPLFANIGRSGGELLGLPVVVSQNVGSKIIALNADDILLAEDPGVSVDVSDQATVEMDDVPVAGDTSPFSAATTVKSFWQNNLIGVRVEQFITWKAARTSAVEYLANTNYVA